MVEQAFYTYIAAIETKFKKGQRPPVRKGCVVERLKKDDHLRALVQQLEDSHEFSALLEETRSAFRSDDWHSARRASWWTDPIQNFFRRTGYYTNKFDGSDTPCDLFERYEAAFQRRSVQTMYLAPMEFVEFVKPELKFSGFEIRRFDRKELEEIVGNGVNRVFYPYAFLDKDTLDALQGYWFVVGRDAEEVRRLGWLTIAKEDLGWVSLKYTHFPTAIERALERLVLFDWVEVRKGQYDDPIDFPRFAFNIPFVIRVDDNYLNSPGSAPDRSMLKSYLKEEHPDTGEVYEDRYVIFDLNESRVAAFQQFIRRADKCLRHLGLEIEDTHWPFLKVAIGNLIKAFFTEELEQLLWHITALEALLGEPGPGVTASLARRSAAILSTTEKERKECRKKFRELYDLRSALVHGRQFKDEVHRKHLFEARMMVLRVTISVVQWLGEIAARINEESWQANVPKREDILNLLDLSNADCILSDLSNADRNRLSALLSNFPTGFPGDFLSLSNLSDADRNRLKLLLSSLPSGFPCTPTWSAISE